MFATEKSRWVVAYPHAGGTPGSVKVQFYECVIEVREPGDGSYPHEILVVKNEAGERVEYDLVKDGRPLAKIVREAVGRV